MKYRVDIRDLKFQLLEWLPTEELLGEERFADWDRENVEMVIDEAETLAKDVFGPTNQAGDREGVRLEDGKVITPDCYKAAYKTLSEGGWVGCTSRPELGGLGLPEVVGTVVHDLFSGANLAFSLTTLLTRGTAHLIEDFGTDEMRALFCERLYTGRWTGTMCLTEPQAGSDVGASTTRAVRQDDGRYLIRGEKIFITSGDHDLTDNIVHSVLARTAGAPAGTKGLSLFIVPKVRVRADGGLGEPNDVLCTGIEHKMGIHGSATCSMSFGPHGACEGFLLGEEGEGMRLMFQMMNTARIEVGLQGAAVAAAAHQAALDYAKERLQMRPWSGRRGPDQVPIIEHPDVRRMLLQSSSYVQAMRALLLRTSYYVDKTRVSEGEERERYQGYVELLTPICKAWASDWGFRVTEWCLQVYGGYGYTVDYPAEQYLRDAKITSLYEGTNGIQALDFVGRKLRSRGGRPLREILAEVAETVDTLSGDEVLGGPAGLLNEAVEHLRETLGEVARRQDAPLVMVLNAVPLLDMFGTTLGAAFLLDQARLARRKLDEIRPAAGVGSGESSGEDSGEKGTLRAFLEDHPEAAFYHDKVQSAVCFAYRALPLVRAQSVAVRAGETAPMDAVL